MFNESDEEHFQEQYQIKEIEKIGEGSFGKVYKAVDLQDNKLYAVKVINKSLFKDSGMEPCIFQSLSHPNIVKLKRVCENKSKIYMIMELMEGGSLTKYIQKRKSNPLTEIEAATIMKHILSAVQYIHEQQVIHRDLKPENILLAKKDDIDSVSLADFGLSFQFSAVGQFQKLLIQKCGTILYMAPEQVSNKQYGKVSLFFAESLKPVDLWSCGIIMYMLLSQGKHPLFTPEDSKETLIEKIQNPQWVIGSNFSPLAKDLFLKLTIVSQSERYKVSQALGHPWVTRRFDDQIPLTFDQSRLLFEKKLLFKLIQVLEWLKKESESSQKMIEYRKEKKEEKKEEKQQAERKEERKEEKMEEKKEERKVERRSLKGKGLMQQKHALRENTPTPLRWNLLGNSFTSSKARMIRLIPQA